jgi:hypothetical protein
LCGAVKHDIRRGMLGERFSASYECVCVVVVLASHYESRIFT